MASPSHPLPHDQRVLPRLVLISSWFQPTQPWEVNASDVDGHSLDLIIRDSYGFNGVVAGGFEIQVVIFVSPTLILGGPHLHVYLLRGAMDSISTETRDAELESLVVEFFSVIYPYRKPVHRVSVVVYGEH